MVQADIRLSNSRKPKLKAMAVSALVDTGALVIGESVLLGAVPMEDMDLVISPSGQTITVNPKSPNIPSALVK